MPDAKALGRLTAAVADVLDALDFEALGCLADPVDGLDIEDAHFSARGVRRLAERDVPFCGATWMLCTAEHTPSAHGYFTEWGSLAPRAAVLDDVCHQSIPRHLEKTRHVRLVPHDITPRHETQDTYVLFFEHRASASADAEGRWYLRALRVDWHTPRCPS